MFFRTPRFIRRWIRRRMHPMHEDDAHDVRQKLSYLYIFFAWNAAGYVGYQIMTGNKHWPVKEGLVTPEEQALRERPSYWFAKTLNIPKAEVYKIKGLTVAEMPPIDILAETEAGGALEQEKSELVAEAEKLMSQQVI